MKLSILNGEPFSEKLFFPDIKDQNVWELLSDLERLADYYETSTLARDFIDDTVLKIKESKHSAQPSFGYVPKTGVGVKQDL